MATAATAKMALSPDQQLILDELQQILDQVLQNTLDNSNGKRQFIRVHHGALIPSPAEFDCVFENIYIGGEKLAKDISKLKATGITHVVNCAQGKKFSQVDTSADFYSGSSISYYGIPGHDSIKFDISAYFQEAAKFIHDGVGGGKVYIHCHQGISRCTTVTVAYLMLYRDMTAASALSHILQHRIVLPNKGFLKRLALLQHQLDNKD